MRSYLLGDRDLTPVEAARLLHVSPRHVLRLIDRGVMRAYTVPGAGTRRRHRRIRRADVEALCREHEIPQPVEAVAAAAPGGA